MELFKGVVIVTKHKKELVIQPLIEGNFNMKCFVTSVVDTDELGTFSGEVTRKGSPLDAAREKCLLGMKFEKVNAAIASEGSFGPHPQIPFVQANEEIVMFVDQEANLEIFARELSLKSNARSSKIENLKDLKQFAKECLFPSHGLILRQDEGIHEGIKKGIIEEELLFDYAQFLIEKNGYCFAETDMRAMYNPTRMEVIKRATEKLVSKIKRRCEKCLTPGFDIESVKIGLPCRVCGFKTRVVRAHTYSCKKCGHKQIEEFPNGMTEDPMFCDVCNP